MAQPMLGTPAHTAAGRIVDTILAHPDLFSDGGLVRDDVKYAVQTGLGALAPQRRDTLFALADSRSGGPDVFLKRLAAAFKEAEVCLLYTSDAADEL